MTRTRIALVLATGLLGLTACASPAAAAVDETAALQAVGFDTASAVGKPAPNIRRYLRKNTLHGEVTLTKKTVVVQRGTITAVSATSVSVKSTDGFALTWTLGDKLRVVQDKKKTDKSALKNGGQIGIAGVKDGTADTARVIVVG